MLPADRLIRSASARRLMLWGGLGAGALALSSLAAFAQGHALMINVSPSLPYWALWVTRGATLCVHLCAPTSVWRLCTPLTALSPLVRAPLA